MLSPLWRVPVIVPVKAEIGPNEKLKPLPNRVTWALSRTSSPKLEEAPLAVKLPPDTDIRELPAALRPWARRGPPPPLLTRPVNVPPDTETLASSQALRPLAKLSMKPPLLMLPVTVPPDTDIIELPLALRPLAVLLAVFPKPPPPLMSPLRLPPPSSPRRYSRSSLRLRRFPSDLWYAS